MGAPVRDHRCQEFDRLFGDAFLGRDGMGNGSQQLHLPPHRHCHLREVFDFGQYLLVILLEEDFGLGPDCLNVQDGALDLVQLLVRQPIAERFAWFPAFLLVDELGNQLG